MGRNEGAPESYRVVCLRHNKALKSIASERVKMPKATADNFNFMNFRAAHHKRQPLTPLIS